MRFAYIKNGDVVDQYKRVIETWNDTVTSGPDAFIKSFIQSITSCELLLLSLSSSSSDYIGQNAVARVFSTGRSTATMLAMNPLALVKIFFSLIKYRPDYILCGKTGGALWTCYLAARILSVPIVHSRHNQLRTIRESLHRRIRSSIDAWVIRRVDGVVCHGPYLKQDLLDIGVNSNILFEFDVGFEDLLELSRKNSNTKTPLKNRKIILYIGRMEVRKGIVDLFDACRELLTARQDVHLLYIGGGSAIPQLRDHVAQANLNDSVTIQGEIPHDDIAGIIPQCSVVITPTQPSFPEGRCMVAMESLALGVPVIAPEFGPFPFLVTHGENGMLFKPGCVESLKASITSYFDNTELQSRLKTGSIESGRQLLHPDMTFGQAVQSAFQSSN